MIEVVDRDDEETLLENVNFRFPISGATWVFLQQSVEKGIENVNFGIELPTKNPLIDGEMDCNQLAQGRLQGRTYHCIQKSTNESFHQLSSSVSRS